MSDMIDREVAIDVACEVCEVPNTYKCKGRNIAFKWCEEITALREIPSAEPKKGRWVETIVRGSTALCCSNCGQDSGSLYRYNYCPCCGAKMR